MANTVPIVDPHRGWRMWYQTDIYTGPAGIGQYVPNVNDMILDWTQGFYRVISVNEVTNVATSISWTPPDLADGIIPEDILLGAGPGAQSESYRVFINTDVNPRPLSVSGRLRVYGSAASYCKLFRGTNISATGIVISAILDQNGNVITENLPMELVETNNGSSPTIKVVSEGYCTEDIEDGEVVTAVIYNSSGNPISIDKLLIKKTNFIRTTDASRKYITTVEIVSPYLSNTDNRLLEYPINVLIQSGSIRGRVNYSDGSNIELPIDGTKFSLLGMDSYVATVVGQRIPLMLRYTLANNEYGYNVSGVGADRFISEDYEITTTELVGAYSVKLFVSPIWVSTQAGYTLKYYLYNLNRDEIYDVTPYVSLVAPYNTYNPLPNGNAQTLSARIELSAIGAGYGYYAHTQTFTITLLTAGTVNGANWQIRYSNGGPLYGGNHAIEITNTGTNLYSADISVGALTQADWLDALYFNSEPLIHPQAESRAPEPTHFRIKIGNSFTREIPVFDWSDPITNIALGSPDPKQGDVARLEFIKRDGNTDYEVGIGIMPIHIV